MPAYNEGIHIYENLLKAGNIINRFCPSYEIIAVNDGSTDETDAGIRQAADENSHIKAISYPENKGKGFAIVTGVNAAKGRYISYLDSDLELPPKLLKSFIHIMETQGADIVIGSKQHPDSKLNYPLSRRIMSYGYYVLLKILFHMNIHDTQTGIKLFKSEAIKPVACMLHTNGYAFDIEILAMAHANGCRIAEAPIVLNYSRDEHRQGRRIHLIDICHTFTDTLRIKKNVRIYMKNHHSDT